MEFMSLGDELFQLRHLKSSGAIGPVEYYQSLPRLLDAPSDGCAVAASQTDVFLRCVRRIGALLDDRFGASGADLRQKMDLCWRRISAGLRVKLVRIAAIERQLHDGTCCAVADMSGLAEGCLEALTQTLREAVAASPAPPRVNLNVPVRVTRGLVRGLRHSKHRILPKYRALQYLSIVDLDGRLEMITSQSPILIDPGDQVATAGWTDNEAEMYYNESKRVGSRGSPRTLRLATMAGWAGALSGVVLILKMIVLFGLDIHFVHSGRSLVKHASLGALGIVVAWIGLSASAVFGQVTRVAQALDDELKRPPRSQAGP